MPAFVKRKDESNFEKMETEMPLISELWFCHHLDLSK